MKFKTFKIVAIISIVLFNNCQKPETTVITKVITISAAPNSLSSILAKGEIIELSTDQNPEYGICYGKNEDINSIEKYITLNNPIVGEYSIIIDNLIARDDYYIRAFCKNGDTYRYGDVISCTTASANITTTDITNISINTATCGGSVNISGNTPPSKKGLCWAINQNPKPVENFTDEGSGNGTFTNQVTDLSNLTQYYIRSYAIVSSDTIYGEQKSFTTLDYSIPSITTIFVSTSATIASCNGTLTNNGGKQIESWGLCWSTSPNPTIDLTTKTQENINGETFTSTMTGLEKVTNYYVRAYATNSIGVGYGNEIVFTTIYGPISDIDGNTYNTQVIGSQVWMAENLKTTHYNDGTPIPNVTGNAEWLGLTSGAYCWYNNEEANYKEVYGALYNYYAVIDSRGICPSGWHIPTFEEWMILINYLGGLEVAGGKLKATTLWESPNTGASNSSGFLAYPAGYREQIQGLFYNNLVSTHWWTSSETQDGLYIFSFGLLYNEKSVSELNSPRIEGLSVRCIKD